jgi:hypothetical protein
VNALTRPVWRECSNSFQELKQTLPTLVVTKASFVIREAGGVSLDS